MKNNHTKQLGVALLVVLIGIGGIFAFKTFSTEEIVSPEEQAKIDIDKYNFEQLKKAKKILKIIPKDDKYFRTLKDYNNIYSADIQPIENCYYVSNRNGDEDYIFGFKLESDKYIKKYGGEYYAYPKYDMPVMTVCTGYCYDRNRTIFEHTIKNPCKE